MLMLATNLEAIMISAISVHQYKFVISSLYSGMVIPQLPPEYINTPGK